MSNPITYTKALDTVLNRPIWPQTLDGLTSYRRQHDDTDGSHEGVLTVTFGRDGDAYVTTDRPFPALRFRTGNGGGSSLRVQAALLVLAEAIRRDNAERPQRIHQQKP